MSKLLRNAMSKLQLSTQRTGLAACTFPPISAFTDLQQWQQLGRAPTQGSLCPLCSWPQLSCSSGNASEVPSQKLCSSVSQTGPGDIGFFLLLSNPSLPPFHLGPLLLVVYILNTETRLFSSIQKHFMQKTYFVLPCF